MDVPPRPPPFVGTPYTELTGKVAVITGGTSGIGLAVAMDLVQNGARHVIVSGRDVVKGAKAVKMLNQMCGEHQQAVYVPMDVTVKEELKGAL